MDAIAKNRIEEKLARLDETLSTMEKIVPKSYADYEKAGKTLKWDVERGLQLISEMEMDIAVVLFKTFKKGVAGEETSILTALSKELGDDMVDHLKSRRKLRNALVHDYAINNDKDAFSQASDFSDIKKYKTKVKEVITKF